MNDDYIPILSRADGEAQAQRTPHQTTERPLSDHELARLRRDTAEIPVVTKEQGVQEAKRLGIQQVQTFDRPPTPQAAWRTIPSWYMVATEDHAINPDLERFYAKRMNARTTEVKSSHVMYISHPADVARVIEEAAKATAIQP